MELEARGWTQKQLAEVIGRDVQLISGIIKGKRAITPETAIQLSQALDIDAEVWMNLESNFRLFQAHQAKAQCPQNNVISRRAKLQQFGSYSELVKRGWVVAAKTIEEQEANLKRFFGESSLDNIKISFSMSCKRSPYWESKLGSIAVWLRRVNIIAHEAIDYVGDFSHEKIDEFLPELLALSLDANDILQVPKVLAKMGIVFIIVPSLPNTHLDASVFYSDGHPVIGMTLRYDRLDNFWFALFHELGHIYLKHDSQRLDCLFDKDRETDEMETDADSFAQDLLIPKDLLTPFESSLRGKRISKAKVVEFAIMLRRNPAIVVGRLQHDGILPFNAMRDMLTKVRSIARPMTDKYLSSC